MVEANLGEALLGQCIDFTIRTCGVLVDVVEQRFETLSERVSIESQVLSVIKAEVAEAAEGDQ